MTQSPGHQKWPDHKVEEKHLNQRLQVEINGEIIADSSDVIEVDEDQHPPRYYISRADVDMDKLAGSNTTTTCPFKGEANYYSINFGSKKIEDAAWSYEDPYDEHRALKDYVAFHEEIPDLEIKRVH